MDEVVLDIKQWGNNLGVRLPAAIARAVRLSVHQPTSFDWRLRGTKKNPLGTLTAEVFEQVCERLNQIIQVACVRARAAMARQR